MSSPLRVLHCIYDHPANPWVGGGGATRVVEIYRRLADRVQVTVATGNYPGAATHTAAGVRYVHIGAARPYALSRWTFGRQATRLLHAHGTYDVGLFDFSVYSPVRLPLRGPVGVVVHMPIGPSARGRWGPLLGRAVAARERRMLRRARWISTTSNWMAARLRELVRPETRIELVGSGVEDEFFAVQRDERDYVLYYGRFDVFQKGLDTLLEAAALLLPNHERVRLVIAGRGKDEARLRELVARSPVSTRVELRANVARAEVLDLLGGALALVMPSRFEGLPMVPAEAMAAGVPIVAAAVGATDEVVGGAGAGVLVPPDEPRALADAVAALLRDPARRRQMSDAARATARRFSLDHVAEQHLHFLETIHRHETPAPRS